MVNVGVGGWEGAGERVAPDLGGSWSRADVGGPGLVVGSGLLDRHSASAIDVAYLEPGDAVRVSDGPVNFRDGAGLDAAILDVVAEGALFEVRGGPVYGDGYAWVNVFNYGYGTGWMATDFLAVDPNGFPGDGQ